ncbi:DedA family protein [Pontibacter sp. KCTC 32443]|uniref:DedA family protein n=1 Tax=Pontibacter TaxID=323449 RepID=UPI00164E5D76|nr:MULTISPECIES: DedA family protein [Pontibacter]MBC5773077.1 DedA family protein [Pontibacter sp. KCTC 32443]
MEFIHYLIDFILNIDQHLVELVKEYKNWIYLILFLIIFCETGLVVTPFLPGDSLLFALGALAAVPEYGLNFTLLMVLLCVAAILGDSFNYYTGTKIGDRVYLRDFWFLRRKHIDETHKFYEKYGGRTIIYARFMPIVRTFAPFVAGIGKMNYRKFLSYNVIGAIIWISFFMVVGYIFGNIPAVKRNFTLLILGIIALSLTPPIIGVIKNWIGNRKKAA